MRELVVLGCCLWLAFAGGPAAAHNVIAAAWSVGDVVEGEIGFSSGELAPAGTVVRVVGPDGAELGRTEVEADGLFRFTPTTAVPHRFTADLGQGHVAEVTLALDELPVELTRGALPATEAVVAASERAASASFDPAALERVVAAAVQRELAPVKRELARSRETASLQSIIGGLGYIAGIFGLLFFLYAPRQRS